MITNKTRKKDLVESAKVCRSLLSKAKGLMFTTSMPSSLIFQFDKPEHVPLHMMFVFYPIDVLWLDKEKKVVEALESFQPFSYYSPKSKATFVLELPEGSIKKSGTVVGDRLGFKGLS